VLLARRIGAGRPAVKSALRPLEKVGHEGGDFIFVRAAAALKAAAD